MKMTKKPRGYKAAYKPVFNPAIIGNALPWGIGNIDMLLSPPPSMGYEPCNSSGNQQKTKS
jgi:hypothetical protein